MKEYANEGRRVNVRRLRQHRREGRCGLAMTLAGDPPMIVPDEKIPGTLNAGYATAALFQSFLFIGAIVVDPTTLITMIAAAVAGAWFGAGIFAKWPRRNIQYGMGGALLVAGTLFIIKNVMGDPVGGMSTGLTGGAGRSVQTLSTRLADGMSVTLPASFSLRSLMSPGVCSQGS